MLNHKSVTDRMQSLVQQWETASDRRAIFLDCYTLMTRNMLKAIETGEFNDPKWVNALLQRFAEYYFEALDAYEQNATQAPAVWRITHNAAREPSTMVLQNLLLGINAHINYDLVLTLTEMLEPEWVELTEAGREIRYFDHCHVNDIIGQTVDAVQDNVVEHWRPAMDILDKLLGPLDEWMTSQLIRFWREEVWKHAMFFLQTSRSNREGLRQQIESETIQRAEIILLKDQDNN